jgi:hypothetical protein
MLRALPRFALQSFCAIALVRSCLGSPTTPADRERTKLDDAEAVLDVQENLYAMLQLSSRIRETAAVDASQYFELIEDPLLNLLVPVVIQVVLMIVSKIIIQVLSEVLGLILAELLPQPFAEILWPGMDASSVSLAHVMPESADTRSIVATTSSMSTSTSKTTVTEVPALLEVQSEPRVLHAEAAGSAGLDDELVSISNTPDSSPAIDSSTAYIAGAAPDARSVSVETAHGHIGKDSVVNVVTPGHALAASALQPSAEAVSAAFQPHRHLSLQRAMFPDDNTASESVGSTSTSASAVLLAELDSMLVGPCDGAHSRRACDAAGATSRRGSMLRVRHFTLLASPVGIHHTRL